MRKPIIGLTNAIRDVLESHSQAIQWKYICCEIQKRNLVEITPEQREITYGQPNWHHSVRRILSELGRKGEIVHVSRGVFRKSHG